MEIRRVSHFRISDPKDEQFFKEIEYAQYVALRFGTLISNPRPIWYIKGLYVTFEDLDSYRQTLLTLVAQLNQKKNEFVAKDPNDYQCILFNEVVHDEIDRATNRIGQLIFYIQELQKRIE